jgi:hypothetical protein
MGKRKVHFTSRRMNSKWGPWVNPACGEIAMRLDSPDGTTDTSAVTCARCLRTKAYREAVKAVEEKRG